ncbi:MAG: alanine--tRNA ligase [Bacilli bacterium]|nr:alanine--tRNA ligase [Bacilli bacterium]
MKIREKYIDFFVSKGHKQIPSSPVVPENDPSVLFNTAGMQPLIPYLMGEKHPYGTRLCDYQKCVRTNDLDEVGDKTHHTFFEMLGNWSLGDYFKEESIEYSFEFLTRILNIPVERLAVTVFEGDENIPRDDISANKWKSLGISEDKIAYLGKDDNFWIAGETGPCGSDTEIFYFRSSDTIPEKFDPEDDRWVEIWNNVFMEYYKKEDGTFTKLKNKNVDTGMGLERIVATLEGVDDNYKSSLWANIIKTIESVSNKKYDGNEISMRIIADHIRAAVFISADNSGIKPSNTDQGYILRRLIRRAIRHAKKLDIDISSNWDEKIALAVIDEYKKYYSELEINKQVVLDVLKLEKEKFNKTLEKGLREFEKMIRNISDNKLDKDLAFKLYDTYGFPVELTIELADEKGIQVDIEGFKEKFKAHQELSRTSSKGKFKGGLSGNSEIETKYHTATHLLNAALKKIVNKDIHQRGSNITSERLRFDFNCDHKLTDEEKKMTEDLVNKWIKDSLDVTRKEMSKEDAIKSGAECQFIEKYPNIVTVYSIGDVSKELCGGPHVKNTNELGHFKIVKEEASSSGVRRIKAIIEVGDKNE